MISRVVQRVPVQVDGQVQVPGLEHVPVFEQIGEQTARRQRVKDQEGEHGEGGRERAYVLCSSLPTTTRCKCTCSVLNRFRCFDKPVSRQLRQQGFHSLSPSKQERERRILRVVQVAPDHDEVHVQVFGAEQIPPFWQLDEHTATRKTMGHQ